MLRIVFKSVTLQKENALSLFFQRTKNLPPLSQTYAKPRFVVMGFNDLYILYSEEESTSLMISLVMGKRCQKSSCNTDLSISLVL